MTKNSPKGLRDIITHHYIDINAEAIYEICKNKIPLLKETIKTILKEQYVAKDQGAI